MKKVTFDAANIVVHMRAFPFNLFMKNDKDEGEVKLGDWNAERKRLETFIFNDVICFQIGFNPNEYETICPSRNIHQSISGYVRHVFQCFRLLETGTVVSFAIYQILDSSILTDSKVLIGSELFRLSNEDTLVAKKFADRLVRYGHAKHCSVMKYDLLEDVSDDEFKEQMSWRAWGTTQYFSFSSDLNENPWPQAKSADKVDLELAYGSIRLIAENRFGWWLPNEETNINSLLFHLEPITYMLAKRSIIAGGVNNLREIARYYVSESRTQLSPEILRQYDALIRLNIINVDDYTASTEKESRRVYRWAHEQNQLPQVMDDASSAHAPVAIALESMDREKEEQANRRVGIVLLVFTSLTFLSVVADIVGLLDYRQTMFLFEERFTIFASALALTFGAVFVALLNFYRR